jgi:hypothetical protein
MVLLRDQGFDIPFHNNALFEGLIDFLQGEREYLDLTIALPLVLWESMERYGGDHGYIRCLRRGSGSLDSDQFGQTMSPTVI